MIKLLITLLVSLVVSGCMANPSIENMTSAERGRANVVEVLEGDASRPYTVIKTITGLSCERNTYRNDETSDHEALEGIRIEAVKLNADAVINTFCQTKSGVSWKNNCWSSTKCIGEAVVYK